MIKISKWVFIIPLIILVPIFSYLYFINRETKTPKQTTFEQEYASELKGYTLVKEYVKLPTYTLTNEEVNQTWNLKDGHTVEVNCPKLNLDNLVFGDPRSCNVKYDDDEIGSVRYEVWERDNKIEGQVGLVIYSSDEKYEYLIVSGWESGSKDRIIFYNLTGGEITKIPFYRGNKNEESLVIEHPMSFKLFEKDGSMKLATSLHDPSMGNITAYRIWNMEEDGFKLEKTVRDVLLEKDFKSLIPSQYEVEEKENKKVGVDGCISLYSIYPKKYSDSENKNLQKNISCKYVIIRKNV